MVTNKCTCYQLQQGPEWMPCPLHDMPTHSHNVGTKCKVNCPAFAQAAAFYPAKQNPLRQLTSAERKGAPITTGVLHYFPDAIMAVARVSKAGNDKHNPGQPLHWARSKSTDHLDCEGRHLLTPYAVDADSGQLEQAQVAWRALADLQLAEERRLVAAGIMPLSGIIP